jgi:hypothetical protein
MNELFYFIFFNFSGESQLVTSYSLKPDVEQKVFNSSNLSNCKHAYDKTGTNIVFFTVVSLKLFLVTRQCILSFI